MLMSLGLLAYQKGKLMFLMLVSTMLLLLKKTEKQKQDAGCVRWEYITFECAPVASALLSLSQILTSIFLIKKNTNFNLYPHPPNAGSLIWPQPHFWW